MAILGRFLFRKLFVPLIHHPKTHVFLNSNMKLDVAYVDSCDRLLS